MSNSSDELLARAYAVFRASPTEYGYPQDPTKMGYAALAKAGKDVWNAWRLRHPEPSPDFSGIEFDYIANFSEFIFSTSESSQEIDFTNAKFKKKAIFKNAKLEGTALFSDAEFDQSSDFSGCTFGDDADFSRCIFSKTANFNLAIFGDGAEFDKAKFKNSCHFRNVKFGHSPSFYSTEFGWRSVFSGAEFGKGCSFLSATFGGMADFRLCTFIGSCDFSTQSKIDIPEKSKLFYFIDFGGSIFDGDADFSRREFRARTNFGKIETTQEIKKILDVKKSTSKTIFNGIPYFHQTKINQDTSFDGAEFMAPPSPEAARAYRTLKLAMEQLKATREEQRFFRLEMKAEHPSLTWGKRWISTLYSLFSDYGFSLWRPAAWLLALSLAFGTGYGVLANVCAGNAECIDIKAATDADAVSGPDRTSAVIKYTLGSVSPVPGLDKMQTELRAPLFGHQGWISITALALEILHKITTLVMTFLFALALRNLFKMKS